MFYGKAIKKISLLALVALGALAGCATAPNQLNLTSLDHKRQFQQSFVQAFARHDENGLYDVVLVQDSEPVQPSRPDRPLSPGPVTPRQLVHFRIFWKPLPGAQLDHTVASNSTIHWYILATPDGGTDLIDYAGSGLVMLDESDGSATLDIRDVLLKQALLRGHMVDPLGPAILDGSVTAKIDDAQVSALLDEMRAVAATPTPPQAASAHTYP
jgi:hypothetical protein